MKINFKEQLAQAIAGFVLGVPLVLAILWISKYISEDQFVQMKYIISCMFVILMTQGMRKEKEK